MVCHLITASITLISGLLTAQDWPQWRGPAGNNHAPMDATPVTQWSENENIRWKTALSGRGHSTPIIVNGKIFLTTGDQSKGTQSLIAIDQSNGKTLWEKVIHQGGYPQHLHQENSAASATAQWDGSQVLVVFENDQKIKVTAISPNGEIHWSKDLGSYQPSYQFGYGSTPVLHDQSLIVAIGTKEQGRLIALNTTNGKERWSVPRDGHDYWATPIIATVSGKEQLLISGTNKISSYLPESGELLWESNAGAKSMCGTMVWTDGMVFASGGFPEKETVGIIANGSGEVRWKNKTVCYEQSMLVIGDYLYAVADDGRAYCWEAQTGEKQWSERIGRRGVMASPLRVGELIYATLKNGETIVFKAHHAQLEILSRNQLGTDTYASPVALGDSLFMRVGHVDRDQRQEYLYCIGTKNSKK